MADPLKALQALYSAPLATFVAERDRLATELRAGGNDDAAKQLRQRRRPTASAWAVNQLYWHARDEFDALLAAAARLRKGDLQATSAFREALGELRKRATAILQDADHAATALVLRRVAGTLSAIAASGGFDPDPPGALSTDREPPGFDAFVPSTSKPQPQRGAQESPAAASRTAAGERVRLAAERAEERARKQAEKAREAERNRLRTALHDANAELRDRERELSRRRRELHVAGAAVEDARKVVQAVERELTALHDD